MIFTRTEINTMSGWLGKIQRFNSMNGDRWFLSFNYSPFWGTPCEIYLYRITGDRDLEITVNAEYRNFGSNDTSVEDINGLLNLIVKGSVSLDCLSNENWKEFVKREKEI